MDYSNRFDRGAVILFSVNSSTGINIRPVIYIIIPIDLCIVVCNGTASANAFTTDGLIRNGNIIICYDSIYFLAGAKLVKISEVDLRAVIRV